MRITERREIARALLVVMTIGVALVCAAAGVLWAAGAPAVVAWPVAGFTCSIYVAWLAAARTTDITIKWYLRRNAERKIDAD